MRREVQFQTEDFVPAWSSNYSEKKFAIYNTCFLSTKKNTHELDIDEEILRKDAKSILGNFLVAKLQYGDASTHLKDEIIYGYFPREQEIVFEKVKENGSTVVKAKAYCVISKMYGKEFNDIFSYNNLRNTSVEMTVETEDDNEHKVVGFDIYGLTCLGLSTKGSCPDANMKMVRFSEEDANEFFAEVHNNSLTVLKKFVEERKESMADKTYKIDKSKDAMSDTPWQDIDKTELRNKIMEAKNKAALVKSVYLLVEDGWEDAPSEKLKYPVMEVKGDKIVYNRNALASALGYAKKENEESVVSKVKAIYKKLGLGKEEDVKMTEITFAAVDIGDMWGRVFEALHDRYPDGDWGSVYRIDGIYEQDNKKFAIIHRKDEDVKYRLDFSLTEEGLTLADEIVKIEMEIVETDDIKKFAEPENVAKYKKFEDDVDDEDEDKDDDDESVEMSADETKDKIAQMQKDIEEKENIIMEKDRELEELREFKRGVEKKEKMMAVEAILSEVKEFMSEDSIKSLREEGKALSKDQIDAFANKVKAQAFEFSANTKKNKKTDVWSFAAPNNFKENKSKSVWDRI